jgi:hypothetical protein
MKKIIPVLVLISAFFVQPVSSQIDSLRATYAVKDTQDVKVTLFDTDDLVEISLKFDISQYKRVRSDTAYLDAVLTYHINKTDSVIKNIKVRARGNIRRTSAICDFPPLMLNFQMKDSEGAEFAGINKLKIVPYCKIGYEQYILKEYLVYKLYNVLTNYSLKVRLFKITYLNSVKDKKPITQFGFAIEPVSLMEKRTKTKELNYTSVTQRNLNPQMLDRTAIFNYMIGNTDWSVPIKHNVILLTQTKNSQANDNLIVAYDFDYSGIVGTDYSVPFETLPIKTVHDRLYMAICRSETEFANALNEFKEKKDEFYRVLNTFPYLNERSRKDMTNYIDDFYYSMDKRNTLIKKLSSDCIWFENQSNLRIR